VTTDRPIIYVAGCSPQVSYLSSAQRRHLDSAEYVFCVNRFPLHYRQAGFCPTHWAQMDCWGDSAVDSARQVFHLLRTDARLRRRMATRYVNCRDSDERIKRLLTDAGFPVTRFLRGYYAERHRPISDSLDLPMLQAGSSLTGAANLAYTLCSRAEIRVFACEYGPPGAVLHFYDPPDAAPTPWLGDEDFRRRMWEGFALLRAGGVNLVDSNLYHDDLPPYHLPRRDLLAG